MKQPKITNFFCPIIKNNNRNILIHKTFNPKLFKHRILKPKPLKYRKIKPKKIKNNLDNIVDEGYLGDDEINISDKPIYKVINLLNDLKYLKINS